MKCLPDGLAWASGMNIRLSASTAIVIHCAAGYERRGLDFANRSKDAVLNHRWPGFPAAQRGQRCTTRLCEVRVILRLATTALVKTAAQRGQRRRGARSARVEFGSRAFAHPAAALALRSTKPLPGKDRCAQTRWAFFAS